MRTLAIAFAFACAAVGACVGTNPDWDGPVADGSDGGSEDDGSSTASTSQSTTGPSSTSSSESEGDSSPTEVNTCVDGPPNEGPCPMGCTGGCGSGVCVIACEGKSCEDKPVECPAGWPCHVQCEGKDRCKKADVTCPPLHACEVECSGEHACEDLTLSCGDGPCAMACSDHPQACNNASMGCGAADGHLSCALPQDGPPTVQPTGGSACACEIDGC